MQYEESYKNLLDADGELISSEISEPNDLGTYTMYFEEKKYDDQGNIIEMVMTNSAEADYRKIAEGMKPLLKF